MRWTTYYYYYQLYTDVGGLHFSPIADEASTYEILARQILSGNGLSHELFSYRPPLQPMFIALTYLVSGSTNPLIAVFLQSFISTGVTILTFIIAKELNMSVITFSGFKSDNPLRKLGDINFWVDSKAYNFVENIHQVWLLTIVDLVIGKREYLPS